VAGRVQRCTWWLGALDEVLLLMADSMGWRGGVVVGCARARRHGAGRVERWKAGLCCAMSGGGLVEGRGERLLWPSLGWRDRVGWAVWRWRGGSVEVRGTDRWSGAGAEACCG